MVTATVKLTTTLSPVDKNFLHRGLANLSETVKGLAIKY